MMMMMQIIQVAGYLGENNNNDSNHNDSSRLIEQSFSSPSFRVLLMGRRCECWRWPGEPLEQMSSASRSRRRRRRHNRRGK